MDFDEVIELKTHTCIREVTALKNLEKLIASIEPFDANYEIQILRQGTYEIKPGYFQGYVYYRRNYGILSNA